MKLAESPRDIEILGASTAESGRMLAPAALSFVAKLARKFEKRWRELLAQRARGQAEFNAAELPPELQAIRDGAWKVAPPPHDLHDRRVEITGSTDRKAMIAALNSGANIFVADFEGTPTWSDVIEGQINLHDAVRRTIAFASRENDLYRLDPHVATLFVHPRAWHLLEEHLLIDGNPVAASIFDFGLYFFHNAKHLITEKTGPYFYLTLESHLEARVWNDIFVVAQLELGIPVGTIKAAALVETVSAAFEMNEILYELRDHSAGLAIGRGDAISTGSRRFPKAASGLLHGAQATVSASFMRDLALLLVKTCHRRGAHAIGGVSGRIPVINNEALDAVALEAVRADKLREATIGCDGTRVAHPRLVEVAKAVFDEYMPRPNQLHRQLDAIQTDQDLLALRALSSPASSH